MNLFCAQLRRFDQRSQLSFIDFELAKRNSVTKSNGTKTNNVPLELMAAPLFWHIVWTRIKVVFQHNYTREEVLDLVPDGHCFL